MKVIQDQWRIGTESQTILMQLYNTAMETHISSKMVNITGKSNYFSLLYFPFYLSICSDLTRRQTPWTPRVHRILVTLESGGLAADKTDPGNWGKIIRMIRDLYWINISETNIRENSNLCTLIYCGYCGILNHWMGLNFSVRTQEAIYLVHLFTIPSTALVQASWSTKGPKYQQTDIFSKI